jgi:hypothetical protein
MVSSRRGPVETSTTGTPSRPSRRDTYRRGVSPPALERLVDGHGAREVVHVVREVRHGLVPDPVRGGDPDLVHLVEYVELGERDRLDPAPAHGGAGRHGVEPACPPWPSGRGAELVAALPQVVAGGVVQLGREWAAPHPRRIGLEDAQHAIDHARGEPARRRGEAREAPGGGHVRVGSVVEVEQAALGSLEEDRLAGRGCLRQGSGDVAEERCERQRGLDRALDLFGRRHLDRGVRPQRRLQLLARGNDGLTQATWVAGQPEADARPRRPRLVRGPDPAPGGAEPRCAA